MARRAAILLMFLGCSNSSGSGFGTDAGGNGPTFEETAGELAKAYCDRGQACAPAALRVADGDVATCQTRFVAAIVPTLGASGAVVTPAQLRACAQALPGVSCADFLARKSAPECKLPAGTLADGAPCAADMQCAGTRCRIAVNHACGTCGSHAGAGGPCAVDDDCDPGLGCVNAVCTSFGSENDACDATHPCRPGLGCVSGKCGAPSAIGAACASSAECDGTHGVFCGAVSKQCDAVTFDSPNQACGIVQQHLALCAGPGGYCAGLSSSKIQGTCLAPAADGAACDAVNGPLCNAGAVCVCSGSDAGCAGTCSLPSPSACR
jgi:hypothetical protein